MFEQVRVGIIGTSWWVDLVHLPCLQSHPQARVVAICGRHRDRAEEMAKKYAVPQVFTDYREMIEKGHVQALVIAAPDDLHYPMTMDALDAGLHVCCEKPMAANAIQAKAMCEKATGTGVTHMVMFTHRWWPHIVSLKRLIDDGYIGRCYHGDLCMLWEHGREARYTWRFDRTRSNGVLGDLGSHMIDLAQLLVGDIVRLCAHLTTFVERPGPEGQSLDPANDSALLLVEFAHGAHGSIHISYVPYLGDRKFEMNATVHGQSGTLEARFSDPPVEIHGIRDGMNVFETMTFPNRDLKMFAEQPIGVRLFIDSIVKGQPATPDFYDGLKVQEVIDAAIQSHQSGRWVSIQRGY